MSFNGGKDCVVLLYLFQAVLEELKFNGQIKAVFFQSDDQFSEEEDYVESTVNRCIYQKSEEKILQYQ